jgi:hypothetical protein
MLSFMYMANYVPCTNQQTENTAEISLYKDSLYGNLCEILVRYI